MHFLHGGLTLDTSVAGSGFWPSMIRGAEVTLTSVMIDSTRDRLGRSWLELLDDAEAQVARWRRVTIRRGPWPDDDLDQLDPETSDFEIERERAYAEVAGTEDPVRRTELRAAADRRFAGPPGANSTTIAHYGPRPTP